MRIAAWRDTSRTSALGQRFPEYRLRLPYGEAVLYLPLGTIYNKKDIASQIFMVRCSNVGIRDTSTGEKDPVKAQKAALELLKKRFTELQERCQANMAAIEQINASSAKRQAMPETTEETASHGTDASPAKKAVRKKN